MQGWIMIDKRNGWKWVLVQTEHIYFHDSETGKGTLIVAAFRSDGYRRIAGGFIPMQQWLDATYTISETLEVPDDIVMFAVGSERLRQEEVGGVANRLQRTAMSAGEGDEGSGFNKFLKLVTREHGQTEAEEHAMGLRIQKLMAESGGQQ